MRYDERTIVSKVERKFPWIKRCHIENAYIYVGVDCYGYECLIWMGGIWHEGVWPYGEWKCGTWRGGIWMDGSWEYGTWEGGTWENGMWNEGIWKDGTWLNGTWNDGTWEGGTWKSGIWMDGIWEGGVWMDGLWIKGSRHKSIKKIDEEKYETDEDIKYTIDLDLKLSEINSDDECVCFSIKGKSVTVKVLRITHCFGGVQVRLGFTAPREIQIMRKELIDKQKESNDE